MRFVMVVFPAPVDPAEAISCPGAARSARSGQRLGLHDVSMCPNTEAALALAAAGIAYTVLPDIPAMRRHDPRFIPIEESAPIVVGARVRRGRRPAPLERFIELLGEELRREPSA